MPVTPASPAPYAPASAVVDLIERHRNKGLPSPVDGDVLGRVGVSASLIPRTLQALQALDLIDEKGAPTQVLEGIRLAPEADYKASLLAWLRAAYADALQYVDPATADETAIRDAFRQYNPVGQQPRMVTLFSGLFRAAGLSPEKAASSPRKKAATGTASSARTNTRTLKNADTGRAREQSGVGHLPAALAGLLAGLPGDAGWTQAQRDNFMKAFGAVLDFCFPPQIMTANANEAESTE